MKVAAFRLIVVELTNETQGFPFFQLYSLLFSLMINKLGTFSPLQVPLTCHISMERGQLEESEEEATAFYQL